MRFFCLSDASTVYGVSARMVVILHTDNICDIPF